MFLFLIFPLSLASLPQSYSRKQDSRPCSMPVGWVMRLHFLSHFLHQQIGGASFSWGFRGLHPCWVDLQCPDKGNHSFHQQQWKVVDWSVGRDDGNGTCWEKSPSHLGPELHGASATQGARLLEVSHDLALPCMTSACFAFWGPF